ncbi:MAG: hypothetical protein J6J31_00105 [Thermoguttaceae bacterium]|nr:hypothetical protein [Thermoguttaceae bacterium]
MAQRSSKTTDQHMSIAEIQKKSRGEKRDLPRTETFEIPCLVYFTQPPLYSEIKKKEKQKKRIAAPPKCSFSKKFSLFLKKFPKFGREAIAFLNNLC